MKSILLTSAFKGLSHLNIKGYKNDRNTKKRAAYHYKKYLMHNTGGDYLLFAGLAIGEAILGTHPDNIPEIQRIGCLIFSYLEYKDFAQSLPTKIS